MLWSLTLNPACLRNWQSLALAATLFCLLVKVECGHETTENPLSSKAYEWGLLGGYPQQSFKSSDLRPPRLNNVQWDEQCASGFTLLSLRGVLVPKPTAVILDERGDLVWMDESFGFIMNMKIQRYKGQQYLTFWSGSFGDGFGRGAYYMLDSHYQIYKQFTTAGVTESDFHEYTITDDDTALLTSYNVAPADLSSLGVTGQGWIYDSTFQEIDIETGELLFEWRASKHYAINESLYPIGSAGRSPEHAYDFFHINSVDKDDDGNYIVSSRFLHSVTCISAETGEILWILGGARNDFMDLSDGRATDFRWQHHANYQGDGTISIFDNAKYMKWYTEIWDHGEISRGMMVYLDTDNMTVELVQEYLNPTSSGAPQQGSMQVLEDSGNVLVGWGYQGGYTEYSSDGEILCDTHINPSIFFDYGFVHSYRAFRAKSWVGKPKTQPSIYLKGGDNHAYVSWMGSTEIDHWVLQTAADTPTASPKFTDISKTKKTGFETKIELPKSSSSTSKYLRLAAKDKNGEILAFTKTVHAERGTASSGHKLGICAGVFLSLCLALTLLFRKRVKVYVATRGKRSKFRSWMARRASKIFRRRDARKVELEPLYDDRPYS